MQRPATAAVVLALALPTGIAFTYSVPQSAHAPAAHAPAAHAPAVLTQTTASTTTTSSTTSTSTSTSTTTSTTRPVRTTTTVPATTTTTTPVTTSSSSFPWWGWLILALVLVGAIITVVVAAVGRRNRQRAEAAWRLSTVGVLDDAVLARGLLPPSGSEMPDTARWQQVREQVEQVARGLDTAAATSPLPEGAEAARTSASALRNLVFALEADRLLRDGTRAPTPEQLGQADAACRARAAELDGGLARLDQIVRPPPVP